MILMTASRLGVYCAAALRNFVHSPGKNEIDWLMSNTVTLLVCLTYQEMNFFRYENAKITNSCRIEHPQTAVKLRFFDRLRMTLKQVTLGWNYLKAR